MIITHNMLAINAQRQYKVNTDIKKKSTEKLASGYKINRAADDAAGLTISEKMRSMIRGLNQGSYNTQDGISWVQVADGAMNEIHDMLHRLKELAVKSANGTNTDADRKAIDAEKEEILNEIHRIDASTQFNEEDVFLHGDVMFEVYGDPGDLQFYDSVDANGNTTYGGFIFHGERVSFNDPGIKGYPSNNIVRMEDGKQVFNGGTYEYNNGTEHFKIKVADGASVPDAKRELEVIATSEGLFIDGHKLEWSSVLDEDDKPVDATNIHQGTYTTKYGGATFSFTIGKSCSIRNMDEFCHAITWATDVNENGGVGYHWITELDDVYDRPTVYGDPGVFTTTGSNSRAVDNVMAYDSHIDTYGTNLSNNSARYTLMAEVVKTARNEAVKNDIINGTSNTNGTDDEAQDVEVYLIGSDGKEVVGSRTKLSELTHSTNSITSWTKGDDITDADKCEDHGGVTNTTYNDGVTDYYYTFQDPKTGSDGRTDISIRFRLSEVASADQIAYNVDIIGDVTKERGLHGTDFTQDFSSKFVDRMTLKADANKKISLASNENKYNVTFDTNIALDRDFDKPYDQIAKIDANGGTEYDSSNPNDKYRIKYDSTAHTFSFSVGANDLNKTVLAGTDPNDAGSVNLSVDNRKKNNVAFFDFVADTSEIEKKFTKDIKDATEELILNKINLVLSGKLDDASSHSITEVTRGEEKIVLKDDNVIAASTGLSPSSRSYVFGYDYNDILKTFNDGSNPEVTNAKLIKLEMDAGVDYGKLSLKDTYFKISDGSYISASKKVFEIKSSLNTINNNMKNASKVDRYVLNSLDPSEGYITEKSYETKVKKAIEEAVDAFSLSEPYVITDNDGTVVSETDLFDGYKKDYKGKIDSLINVITSGNYLEDDGFGNVEALQGDALKTAIQNKITLATEDDDIKAKLYDAINDIDFEGLSASGEGALPSAALPSDTQIDAIITELTDNAVLAKKNESRDVDVKSLIKHLAGSDSLKTILNNVIPAGTVYHIDNSELTKSLLESVFKNNATELASKAKAKATKLNADSSITSDNLKDIVKNNLGKATSGLIGNNKDVADIVKNFVDNNWDEINSSRSLNDGFATFSNTIINKLIEQVVKAQTDGKQHKILSYYDGVLKDDGMKTDSSGKFAIDTSKVFKNVTEAADTYVKEVAFKDIEQGSEFEMKANGSVSAQMQTFYPGGSGKFGVFPSDIEIDEGKDFRIYHSGVPDDYTSIKKFCINTAVLKITNINLATQNGSRKALDRIDYANAYVSEKRSYLGGVQNRLEHTYRNNQNKAENLTAAESRIRDTDMAKEMVNQAKQNIVIQINEAMMAQANAINNNILAILG